MTNEQGAEVAVAQLTQDLRHQMAELVLAGWKFRLLRWDAALEFVWLVDGPDGHAFHTSDGKRAWTDLAAALICAWVWRGERYGDLP